MVGTIAIPYLYSYGHNHSKSECLHKQPDGRHFFPFSNGWAVPILNGIQIPNLSLLEQNSTIRNLNLYGIQTPTVKE